MQLDPGNRSVGVVGDRESDEDEQSDTEPDSAPKRQMQTTAAEIIEDSVLFERLLIGLDAPHYRRNGCLDTRRGPALLAGIEWLRVAIWVSTGMLVPHRPSSSPHVPTFSYDHTRYAMRAHRTKRYYRMAGIASFFTRSVSSEPATRRGMNVPGALPRGIGFGERLIGEAAYFTARDAAR